MARAAAALAALGVLAALRGARGGCGAAEWRCRDGACVPLDAYCDERAQCADGSDEPAGCTVCNRTYYGRAGAAYSLAVRAPRAPLLCHLTFTAGGGAHGDLVQLAFDEFRVGRYEPGALDGCPDGRVQVAELGRPLTGGSWCGEAAGAAFYYSETATVTVSVRLVRARLGEPFALRLRYKFLARRDAVVRFGAPDAPLERGAVSPGTYCTRTYEECHRRPCRLQSPNFPGMYPRNVTCYWSLRQKDVPTCKHAMISVRQEHSHKMQIKRSISMASLNKTGRAVVAWRDCTGERDRLVFYDGASTDDPVLVEYCGGDWLPRVTSRGPEMLVAFHSSPFSAPPRPVAPTAPLRGFELDVDVVFADSDSLDYAREARRCEFHVKASSSEEETNATAAGSGRGRRGRLHAPTHTLPPNATCTWTFHGRPGDLVWIYFSSFTQYSLTEARRGDSGERDRTARCDVELRIWEGEREGGAAEREVGRYCDAPPALCARAALGGGSRPCAPPDGYLSGGAHLAVALASRPGTATHPVAFALHYEFADARLPGAPLEGRPDAEPAECARLVTAPGDLSSPRNALWFGRGGARRLRCVYRVRGAGRVALRLTAAAFGAAGRCATRPHAATGRPTCAPEAEDAPRLVVYEAPWAGYRVPLACLCDEGGAPLELSWGGAGGALELELTAARLEAREDHRRLYFRAEWRDLPAPADCAARRRLPPPGGRLRLVYPYDGDATSECGETPFLLVARGNRSVFLRLWGDEMPADPAPSDPPPSCHTANRLLVYDDGSRLVRVVCPGTDASDEARTVRVFSADWSGGGGGEGGGPAALLVVWAASEPGGARLAWMEVWRAPGTGTGAGEGEGEGEATGGCGGRACPELGACVPPALWCDGGADCPGGADEAGGCGAGARLLGALAAGGAATAAGAGAAGALVALALLVAVRRRRARAPPATLGAVSARRLTEELLYDASRASSAASS